MAVRAGFEFIVQKNVNLNKVFRSRITGWSGRNVAMGVFFWPSVVVNQMNAGDAREAANNRLKVLADLKTKNRCS